MKIIDVVQGSPEWHAHRASHFNASDAPTVMGVGKYKTRAQLLHELATGSVKEVDSFTQQRFDRGHETEAAIRPHIESIIGEDLYPIVGVSEEHPKLSASYDGLTGSHIVTMEHKLWNEKLAEAVRDGSIANDAAYYWQMEHQILVGCKKVLFVVSDGTPEKCVTFEYEAVPGRAEQLLEGWKKFEEDLKNYCQNSAAFDMPVSGRAPDSLPALRIELTGMVTASNLQEFTDHAIAVFRGINKDLQTDEDFADAEKTVKWCGDVESKLEAAKQHALSQTQTIEELFRAVDSIKAEARQVRLDLEKLVKARKDARKLEIINAGRKAFADHIEAINAGIKPLVMPPIPADFAGATKGLKSFASMEEKVSAELIRAKVEASAIADQIRANQASLRELAKDHAFLFADAQQIIIKPNDDLVNLIKLRIAEHEAKEKARLDAERDRIRAEEEAKVRAEQAAKEAPVQRVAAVLDQPQPLPAIAQQAAPKNTATRIMPTDRQIVNCLMTHLDLTEREVYDCIIKMDMSQFGGAA